MYFRRFCLIDEDVLSSKDGTYSYHWVPKLMTCKCINNLLKTFDLSFYVYVGPSYWPVNMHESFFIVIYLPLLKCLHWTLRRLRSVLEVDMKLWLMRKYKIRPQGIVLRQFIAFLRWLSDISDGLLWQLLSQGNIIYISSKLAHG